LKIVIFTSNQKRHLYLIKKIMSFNKDVTCYIEKKNFLISKNKTSKVYFQKVLNSENKIFKNPKIKMKKNFFYRKVSEIEPKELPDDKRTIFLVFGSGLIKGKLLYFLKKKKCLNLHAGMSPFYRGVACNPWSILDGNFKYVGCTILFLSKKIDGGKILFYSKPKVKKKNIFDYSMYALKCGINDLCLMIKKKKFLKLNLSIKIIIIKLDLQKQKILDCMNKKNLLNSKNII